MAAPKKQRRVAPREDDSSDSDNNTENGNDQEMETIEVDFDVKFPESTDRQGIKNLLQQLFLKAHINVSQLADLLIEQNNITGVIKQSADEEDMDTDEDMDVSFGVFSVVNLTEKKNMECIKQISSYLLNHCKEVSSKNEYEAFKQILDDCSKHVGLIISERFINIPAKIAVPLYSGLRNDMQKALEKREAYDFSYYLLISKIVNFAPNPNQENIVFLNPEEELLSEDAEFSFEFLVETEQDSGLSGTWTDEDDEGLPKRRVLLIQATKWDTIIHKLTVELGSDQQHPS